MFSPQEDSLPLLQKKASNFAANGMFFTVLKILVALFTQVLGPSSAFLVQQ